MDRELRPVSRYEWEQIILRARLGGLIRGNGRTRGGVSGTTIKAIALAWASHADPDGGNMYPGDATIAVETETSLKVVKVVKARLLALGLIERVRAGARRLRRNDVYRLTIPTDLLDQIEVLTPAQVRMAAMAEYERQSGRRRQGSGGPLTRKGKEGPEDPSQGDMRGPEDPKHEVNPDSHEGSGGPTNLGYEGSGGPDVRGPLDRDTNHDQTLRDVPIPTQVDLHTELTHSRAREEVDQETHEENEESQDQPTLRVIRGGRSLTGLGLCVRCYLDHRQIVLATDPQRGSYCHHHAS